MDQSLQELVRRRASNRCEYCQFPLPPFHIEHIVARKLLGATSQENLALACMRCNFHKGPNLAGIDAEGGSLVRLFHPRHDVWGDHFRWEGPVMIGTTPVGRATISVLRINSDIRVQARQSLIRDGVFKPS